MLKPYAHIRSRRALPAAFYMACAVFFIVLGLNPAAPASGAYAAQHSAPAAQKLTGQDDSNVREAATHAAFAQMVRQRAGQRADLEEELAAAGFSTAAASDAAGKRHSLVAAGYLLFFSSNPALFAQKKAEMLDTGKNADERLQTLRRQVRTTQKMASYFSEFTTKEARVSHPARNPGQQPAARSDTIAYAMERGRQHQAAVSFILDNWQLTQQPDFQMETLLMLWKLRDRPDDKDFLITILTDKKIPYHRRLELARQFIDSPAAAKAVYARIDTIVFRERQYKVLLGSAPSDFVISLPLAVLLAPEEIAVLEKHGTTPLHSTSGKAASSLTTRSLKELLPEETRDQLRSFYRSDNSALPELPFLQPGEKLFAVVKASARYPRAYPVFTGSPLSDLAAVGPMLVPFDADNAGEFYRMLSSPGAPAQQHTLLVASSASQEELARHLASLGIMHGKRETAFFEGLSQDVRKRVVIPSNIPPVTQPEERVAAFKDIVEAQSRFVSFTRGLFFSEILTQADERGLARLLGPIQAVWLPQFGAVNDDSPVDWLEFRYAPPKAVPGSALGTSPLLSIPDSTMEAMHDRELQRVQSRAVNGILQFVCEQNNLELGGEVCQSLRPVVALQVNLVAGKIRELGFKRPQTILLTTLALVLSADNRPFVRHVWAELTDTERTLAQRSADLDTVVRTEVNTFLEKLRVFRNERYQKKQDSIRREREEQQRDHEKIY